MHRVTLAIFLTVDSDDAANVYDQVDHLLDAGFLQDGINDGLPSGRVKCAVVRHVPPELLTEHNAHPATER